MDQPAWDHGGQSAEWPLKPWLSLILRYIAECRTAPGDDDCDDGIDDEGDDDDGDDVGIIRCDVDQQIFADGSNLEAKTWNRRTWRW